MNTSSQFERLARLETTVSAHADEIAKLREIKHRMSGIDHVQSATLEQLDDHDAQIRACERFRNRIHGASAAIGAASGIIGALAARLLWH